MHITTTPIFQTEGQTLMVLKKYHLDTTQLPIAAAQKELSAIIAAEPEANATWGYFPEIEDAKYDYPACKQLGKAMQDLAPEGVDLAFVRLATSEPVSTFGGFHVDVSPGIAHHWTPGAPANSNILRVLFNVYDKPRRLEYYPYTAEQLRAEGIDIPKQDYQILELPPNFKISHIDIPPIEPDAVYCLQFSSNLIPHGGKTYADGHFLVSFVGYTSISIK